MFPLEFQRRKLIGQWQHCVTFPLGRHLQRKLIAQWLQTEASSNTNTEQRQPQSMAEGLGAGGIEECKDFPPPTVPKANAASPRVPLGVLVSNAPTAARSRRRLTEDLGSAEAIRSAEMVKRARLTKDVQGGGSFLQHLDAICSSGEHVILYMEGAVVYSRYFLAASLFVFSGEVNNVGVPVCVISI